MAKEKKLTVFRQEISRGSERTSLSSVTRLFSVNTATGETKYLGQDANKYPNEATHSMSVSTAVDVHPGTIILEEKIVGLIRRPYRVDYALHVYDGATLHFVGHPSQYKLNSLYVCRNSLPMYFDRDDVGIIAYSTTESSSIAYISFREDGSDSYQVVADVGEDLKQKIYDTATVLAAYRGRLVSRIQEKS